MNTMWAHCVGPDLGPKCLQMLSAEDKVGASKDSDKIAAVDKGYVILLNE